MVIKHSSKNKNKIESKWTVLHSMEERQLAELHCTEVSCQAPQECHPVSLVAHGLQWHIPTFHVICSNWFSIHGTKHLPWFLYNSLLNMAVLRSTWEKFNPTDLLNNIVIHLLSYALSNRKDHSFSNIIQDRNAQNHFLYYKPSRNK